MNAGALCVYFCVMTNLKFDFDFFLKNWNIFKIKQHHLLKCDVLFGHNFFVNIGDLNLVYELQRKLRIDLF